MVHTYKYYKVMLLLGMMVAFTLPTMSDAASIQANDCSSAYLTAEIKTAFYSDLDNDGLQDDVQTSVEVNLYCANRYQFDYYVYLTLPSGLQGYDALGVNTRLTTLTFTTTFYDWAIESGDYQIDVDVILMNGGPVIVSESIIFDPPGGVTGTGPVSTEIS